MHEFDADTQIHFRNPKRNGRATEAGGSGQWDAELSDRWSIGDKPNGGYMIAIATKAMAAAIAAEAGHRHVLTVTSHYFRPGEPGPAEIDVDVVRTGRKLSSATAVFSQSGKERIRAIATFGNLDEAEGPTIVHGAPPTLPPPEQCVSRITLDQSADKSISRRIDICLDPSTGWSSGRPSGAGVTTGWLRFADGRDPDIWSLPLFADSMPPAVFDMIDEPVWVPTIELTVHVRGVPSPGWLISRSRTRFLVDGYLEEDAEIWDSAGKLVAISRQFGMLFRP